MSIYGKLKQDVIDKINSIIGKQYDTEESLIHLAEWYESRPIEQQVKQKTADIELVIMNITQERYERAMNLLDSIKNKKMEITFNQFVKDRMDGDYKTSKLIEQIEIMQKTTTEVMQTLSSFSAQRSCG